MHGPISTGHNALAGLIYFFTFLAFVAQTITGFALYSSMSNSWLPRMFTWIVPLMGGEFGVRFWHHTFLWFFVTFVIVHVYLAFYHDYIEGRGTVSSIIGGWKFEREKSNDKESGIGNRESGSRVSSAGLLAGCSVDLLVHAILCTNGKMLEEIAAETLLPENGKTLVLGLGNVIMGDEGVGVHVVRALEKHPLPANVECLDGGTGGFILLEPLQSASRIILIDAAADGNPIGTVTRTTPRFSRDYPPTLTAHDIGVKDLLDVFYMQGGGPRSRSTPSPSIRNSRSRWISPKRFRRPRMWPSRRFWRS